LKDPTHAAIIATGDAGGKRPSPRSRLWVLAVLAAALSLALKAALLALEAFPFNADEAVVALMARHMLEGARPTFFYGQAYMGSIDAALIAVSFAVLGQKVIVVRLVQSLLYAATAATTVALAWKVTGSRRASLASGLLMAVPTINVTLYTTVSLGGYGEVLLLGNLLVLMALFISEHPGVKGGYLIWGALAGLGLWGFALTLVFAIPAGVLVLWSVFRERRGLAASLLLLAAGFTLGAAPWLAWAARNGIGALVSEAGGAAIAGAGPAGWAEAFGFHLVNLLLLGSTVIVGLRPPWSTQLLAPLLSPIAVAFWIAALALAFRSIRRARAPARVVAGVAIALVAGFLLTPFGVDPSGRYFMPLAAPMAILGGGLFAALEERARRPFGWAALCAILGFNLWGNLETALRKPPGITTQFNVVTQIDHSHDSELIAFLREVEERRGYANYWVSYPLAFLSEEELIYVPRLPYHQDFSYTPRDDRYAPYREAVLESARVAYITTRHPALDERLRAAFGELEVTFREAVIGDYRVFYDLSRPIRPGEIGLGEEAALP
jgi:hypothetical protein